MTNTLRTYKLNIDNRLTGHSLNVTVEAVSDEEAVAIGMLEARTKNKRVDFTHALVFDVTDGGKRRLARDPQVTG